MIELTFCAIEEGIDHGGLGIRRFLKCLDGAAPVSRVFKRHSQAIPCSRIFRIGFHNLLVVLNGLDVLFLIGVRGRQIVASQRIVGILAQTRLHPGYFQQ